MNFCINLFCKVKQFTKTYFHLKILHGVFSYETVAFFQISLTLTVLVCMLAVLPRDDSRIIILINYLCRACVLGGLPNILRVSIKFFGYLVRAGLLEKNYFLSNIMVWTTCSWKFSGQSSKSSCYCFQMAKCFHVYEPFCKVKTFTKRYSHLKNLYGVFSYEIVAFFQILLVYMLVVLLENDLIIFFHKMV